MIYAVAGIGKWRVNKKPQLNSIQKIHVFSDARQLTAVGRLVLPVTGKALKRKMKVLLNLNEYLTQ